MNPFDKYRGTAVYRHLLSADPRQHPWLRWGWSPAEIAEAQRRERARLRGAGDLVARATGAVGIKPCAPCKKRQAVLNRWFPFG